MTSKFSALIQKNARDPRKNLQRFAVGAVLFFIGGGFLVFAEHGLEPSLRQEILALTGLAFLSIGALISAWAYISLSVLRIFDLVKKNDPHQ